jgi:hypothetical protein
MEARQLQYVPEQWKSFIDSSKDSLKAVLLLHNANKHPSTPLVHAVRMKETYVKI